MDKWTGESLSSRESGRMESNGGQDATKQQRKRMEGLKVLKVLLLLRMLQLSEIGIRYQYNPVVHINVFCAVNRRKT
jgi:hypothetical protein